MTIVKKVLLTNAGQPQIRQLGRGKYAEVVHNLWGDTDVFIKRKSDKMVLYHREKHIDRFDNGNLSTIMIVKHDQKLTPKGLKGYKSSYVSRWLENGVLFDKKEQNIIYNK